MFQPFPLPMLRICRISHSSPALTALHLKFQLRQGLHQASPWQREPEQQSCLQYQINKAPLARAKMHEV